MKKIEEKITTPHFIEDVFNFISDMNNFTLWAGVKSCEKITGDDSTHSQYAITIQSFLSTRTLNVIITKNEKPHIFAYKNISLSSDNETGFELYTENDGTVITMYQKSSQGLLNVIINETKTRTEMKKILSKLITELERNIKYAPDFQELKEYEENVDDVISPFNNSPEEVARRFKKSNY